MSEGEEGEREAVEPFFGVFCVCRRRVVDGEEDESDRCVGTGDVEVDDAIDVDCEPLGDVTATTGDAADRESVDSSAREDRRGRPPLTGVSVTESVEEATDVRRTRRCDRDEPPTGVDGPLTVTAAAAAVVVVVVVAAAAAAAASAASSSASDRRIASSIIICSTAAALNIARPPGASGDEPK
jgi:hypothetical protein